MIKSEKDINTKENENQNKESKIEDFSVQLKTLQNENKTLLDKNQNLQKENDILSQKLKKQDLYVMAALQNYQKSNIKIHKQQITSSMIMCLDILRYLLKIINTSLQKNENENLSNIRDRLKRKMEKSKIEILDNEVGESLDDSKHEIIDTFEVEHEKDVDIISEYHKYGIKYNGEYLEKSQVHIGILKKSKNSSKA